MMYVIDVGISSLCTKEKCSKFHRRRMAECPNIISGAWINSVQRTRPHHAKEEPHGLDNYLWCQVIIRVNIWNSGVNHAKLQFVNPRDANGLSAFANEVIIELVGDDWYLSTRGHIDLRYDHHATQLNSTIPTVRFINHKTAVLSRTN